MCPGLARHVHLPNSGREKSDAASTPARLRWRACVMETLGQSAKHGTRRIDEIIVLCVHDVINVQDQDGCAPGRAEFLSISAFSSAPARTAYAPSQNHISNTTMAPNEP